MPPRGMYILEPPPKPPPLKPPPPPNPPPPMRAPPPPNPPPPRPPPRASATSGIRRAPAARAPRIKRVLFIGILLSLPGAQHSTGQADMSRTHCALFEELA